MSAYCEPTSIPLVPIMKQPSLQGNMKRSGPARSVSVDRRGLKKKPNVVTERWVKKKIDESLGHILGTDGIQGRTGNTKQIRSH